MDMAVAMRIVYHQDLLELLQVAAYRKAKTLAPPRHLHRRLSSCRTSRKNREQGATTDAWHSEPDNSWQTECDTSDTTAYTPKEMARNGHSPERFVEALDHAPETKPKKKTIEWEAVHHIQFMTQNGAREATCTTHNDGTYRWMV